MSDFFEFYVSGGVFMHAVSFTAVTAGLAMLLDARARKLGDDDRGRLAIADRLVILCVGLGLLGTAMNVTDLCAALTTIPEMSLLTALSRGGAIVPFPLTWSLMLAIPLWIAVTVQRHRRRPDGER